MGMGIGKGDYMYVPVHPKPAFPRVWPVSWRRHSVPRRRGVLDEEFPIKRSNNQNPTKKKKESQKKKK